MVTRIVCQYCHHMYMYTYCPAPFRLLPQESMSNSETMLEQRRQGGGENTAAETLDERTAALQRLRTATSLTPAPQSSTSTYSNFVLSGVHELRTAAKSIKLITYMHAEHDSSVLPYLVLQVLSCLHWQSCMATITCHYGACDTCTRKWGCTPKQMQKTSILGAAGHALYSW